MPGKSFNAEQIVAKLRQLDLFTAQGKPLPRACKVAGFSSKGYYRWRKEYDGLKIDQAKKFKELQAYAWDYV